MPKTPEENGIDLEEAGDARRNDLANYHSLARRGYQHSS
jgi:hypothetical protein